MLRFICLSTTSNPRTMWREVSEFFSTKFVSIALKLAKFYVNSKNWQFDFSPESEKSLFSKTSKIMLETKTNIFPVGLIPRLNNITFAFPSSPLLSQPNDINVDDQLCTDAHLPDRCSALSPACECTQIVNIPLKSSVEIIMINKGESIWFFRSKNDVPNA